MSTWSKGWGSWHTSDAIPQDCPQGDGSHTVEQAVALNDVDRQARTARFLARERRWLGDTSGTLSSS